MTNNRNWFIDYNLPLLHPIIAKERHVDFITIASQITDFFNQNVVELEGNIVSTFIKNKKTLGIFIIDKMKHVICFKSTFLQS